MSKYVTIFLWIGFLFAFATSVLLGHAADLAFRRGDWFDDDRRIQELYGNYRSFKKVFDPTVQELCRGTLRLEEAHGRVSAAARRHHPKYFAALCRIELGDSDDERVARNLVGHVRENARSGDRQRLYELEAELWTYLLNH